MTTCTHLDQIADAVSVDAPTTSASTCHSDQAIRCKPD